MCCRPNSPIWSAPEDQISFLHVECSVIHRDSNAITSTDDREPPTFPPRLMLLADDGSTTIQRLTRTQLYSHRTQTVVIYDIAGLYKADTIAFDIAANPFHRRRMTALLLYLAGPCKHGAASWFAYRHTEVAPARAG